MRVNLRAAVAVAAALVVVPSAVVTAMWVRWCWDIAHARRR